MQRFSFHSVVEIDVSRIVNAVGGSKENHREVTTGKKSKKVTKKKKIRAAGRKTKKPSARKHRGKKRDVSDIFS